jgi:hypothetical protein
MQPHTLRRQCLSFWFCMVDRYTLDQTVMDWTNDTAVNSDDKIFVLTSRPELGRFELMLTKEEWLDFIELTLSDWWLEQVQGAASKPSALFLWKTGEAYAYRRLAYRKMSRILSVERAERLSTIPIKMLTEVLATEGSETRHLVQPRTPPMSEAAANALEALRMRAVVAGLPSDSSILQDLSPQPYCEATV